MQLMLSCLLFKCTSSHLIFRHYFNNKNVIIFQNFHNNIAQMKIFYWKNGTRFIFIDLYE